MTIAIAARNAEATIARAVESCLQEPACPLLLVDDHCTDQTVARARALAGPRLRVVEAPAPGGVSAARQAGLDAIETPLAAWLDADDEWVEGRASRLEALLADGCDIAADDIDLIDGPSGRWLRRLSAPECLRRPGGAVRLFERNLLPGDTQVAFRTDVYRAAGGYDRDVRGPESYDVLLRALRGGARLGIESTPGYRMHAYPDSVSRQLARQRAALTLALRKHKYEDVRGLYVRAGLSPRVAAWALISMAFFRGEPIEVLRFLDEACPADADPAEILEPDGPWPAPEGWRRAFARGTALLLTGGSDAESEFRHAEALLPTPEGANNLGMALWRRHRHTEARRAFDVAAGRWPGYLDAVVNLTAEEPDRITTHPLRRHPSRIEYSEGSRAATPRAGEA